MDKKIVKITAIIIAIIFILGIAGPITYMLASAAPTQSDLDAVRSEKKSTLEKITELEIELNAADNNVRVLNEEIEKSTKELEEVIEKLKAAEELEKQMSKKTGERFRIMCERGTFSYLDIIFSATNLTDFTDRAVIAKELAEYDKEVMDSMKAVKEEIASKKSDIEMLVASQETAKSTLISAKEELEARKEKSLKALRELEKNEQEYAAYLAEKTRAEADFRRQYASTGTGNVKGISLIWPTNTNYITSNFSPNRVNPVTGVLRPHTGTDVGAQSGAPIWAAASGTVTFAGVNGGYGNCVIINHGNGVSTLYAHMSAIETSTGATVSQGARIGRVGSTGNSTGPHLHFEVLTNGTPIDPMQFF